MIYAYLERNEIIFWDKIIWRTDEKVIDQKVKNVFDISSYKNSKLFGVNATVSFRYNTIPWVGLLFDEEIQRIPVTFPNK
ncbi:hypothetical protein O9G_000312 [Rozella allomycis CSF55]|uniref:Uncharacterized protein n=1 Tax=Rozella allomycis (strain CSF55) TaxID=988480 RepID=A0A075APA7_ROZAC|nr:hypothetical protein O9G_000312 [Rozella allomycis CSF55]|eukprot:EPZ31833.1 hypothetical protein O9G_000312 [Rozella allomycis CSF55]